MELLAKVRYSSLIFTCCTFRFLPVTCVIRPLRSPDGVDDKLMRNVLEILGTESP